MPNSPSNPPLTDSPDATPQANGEGEVVDEGHSRTLLYVADSAESSQASAESREVEPPEDELPLVIAEAVPAIPPIREETAADAIPPVRDEVVLAEKAPVVGPLTDTMEIGQVDRRWLPVRIWQDFICSPVEWVFGGLCMMLGLAILASIPIVQFLSLGYLLEVAGRIARTGRFSDGFIGFRPAARLGGIVLGISACLAPLWLVSVNADSAVLIDTTGSVANAWRFWLFAGTVVMLGHIATALYNGGRLRDFFWPFVQFFSGPIGSAVALLTGGSVAAQWTWLPPLRLLRDVWSGEAYQKASDGLWEFVGGLRLPYYFWLGLRGFAGAFLWLVLPVTLLAAGSQLPPFAGVPLGLLGYLLFSVVLLYLPFVQTHFAAEDRFAAFLEIGEVREQFGRAPLTWWLALFITLAAALPLYLLKIELTPREVTWLPCLVFVAFMWPTKFLLGWAVGIARHREEPTFFLLIWLGRLAMLPVVLFYAFLVYFTQYLSWNGVFSLYEQHPFLTPVPFLGN